MNNWELIRLQMDYDGGLARTFEFEVAITTDAHGERKVMRGDGLLLADKRVRFNREDELIKTAAVAGADPENVLTSLAGHVVQQAFQPATS
jgi:hypothetical protein